MKRVTVVLAIIGAVAFFAALAAVLFGFASWGMKSSVPSRTIVELDLEQGLIEVAPDDVVARALGSRLTPLRDIVDGLERAAGDDRVKALIARIGSGGIGMAQAQEIRDAVLAFRKSGKPAIAFGETFGEAGPGNVGYYVASAFDQIYLQPSGDVGLHGLMLEGVFIKHTLEKLGVVARFDHRYEYKNAMNTFTEDKFTDPHREAMQAIVDSWYNQIVAGIAEGRKLPEPEVRSLIDRGPFLGQEAVRAHLVDGVAYRDEVYDKVREKAGKKAELLYVARYLDRAGRPHQRGETIALISGVGAVTRGKNSFDPLSQSASMGSDSVTAAFREAIDDDDVRAILFRVDSPGGSYVASDAIWRETVRAREKGKPVVVSMGNLAGSGGYFVAMAADKIVAQPGTITGSIGVLGGKMVTTGMWDKIGITFDEVHRGEHATMFSSLSDYTPEEWQRHEDWLDRVYEDFTRKVADGRKMPLARVLELAKGRIWSGEEAKRLGLVDELGGYAVALRLAKAAAKIGADEQVDLRPYPAPKTIVQQILAGEPASSEDAARVALARTMEQLKPAARVLGRLGILDQPGELTMAVAPEP